LSWRELEVDVVLECTGSLRHEQDLRKHLAAGASTVVLSAPTTPADLVPTVVHGVNTVGHSGIFSCASCTTNCIAR
jgi:glyceraldehyde 3-phosphate dehydrogenase